MTSNHLVMLHQSREKGVGFDPKRGELHVTEWRKFQADWIEAFEVAT